jgi:hypothetical protein
MPFSQVLLVCKAFLRRADCTSNYWGVVMRASICFFLFCGSLSAQEVCGLQEAKFDQPELIFRSGFEGTASAINRSINGGLGPAITMVSPPAWA